MTYGDIAELVGTSARRVGAIMRDHGSEVPFWRVISATGRLHVIDDARPHWTAEGIVERTDGLGCRLAEHRADLEDLAERYDERI